MSRIFLVEDEITLSDLLETYLVDAGHDVRIFNDGLTAKAQIHLEPDLWVLDIMLPGLDGYGLIKAIKAHRKDIPVIFMSARSAELDRVIGLEMGSDDYLPKPFLPRELVLRVNRLLNTTTQVTEMFPVIQLGPCSFHPSERIIKCGEETLPLSIKEYDLLQFFITRMDMACSRNDILDQVWGTDYFGSDRVIDDTLRRLRKKIPDFPIETVYGYGYVLKKVKDEEF